MSVEPQGRELVRKAIEDWVENGPELSYRRLKTEARGHTNIVKFLEWVLSEEGRAKGKGKGENELYSIYDLMCPRAL